MSAQPLRIAVISSFNPDGWTWIEQQYTEMFSNDRPVEWLGYYVPEGFLQGTKNLILGSKQSDTGMTAFRRELKEKGFDLVVSCGPRVASVTSLAINTASKKCKPKHLTVAFNFTDLPTGPVKLAMQWMYQSIDTFVVSTGFEKELYSDYFSLKPSKLAVKLWGVTPPIDVTEIPPEEDYVCALGGEARDYETLCKAAKNLPNTRFIVIARPHNFGDLDVPDNVETHFNIPGPEAWDFVLKSKVSLIPLRSRETPCGIVTIVGSMHLGKAIITTQSAGAQDYIKDGISGLLVAPKSETEIVNAIQRLLDDKALRDDFGAKAKDFAEKHCSEISTIEFFNEYLQNEFDCGGVLKPVTP